MKVQYINHAGPLPDGVYAPDPYVFGLKHVAYGFEKEVRIVVTHPTLRRRGTALPFIRVPVNIDRFLRRIVVAPEADDSFFELVTDVARKYDVAAPVRKSDLSLLLTRANVSRSGTR